MSRRALRDATAATSSQVNTQPPSNAMPIDLQDEDSTEETVDLNQEEWETLVREETQAWLALHGAKLFALETSKFNAAAARSKNLRSHR